MTSAHAPTVTGLGWTPAGPPAFVLKACAPARDGLMADAVFVAEAHIARLLLTDRAAEVLGLIQRGMLSYLAPLGCDPADIIWWTEPVARPPRLAR